MAGAASYNLFYFSSKNSTVSGGKNEKIKADEKLPFFIAKIKKKENFKPKAGLRG